MMEWRVTKRSGYMALSVGLVVSVSALGAAADGLPTRRAGLWELTSAMDDGSGKREQKLKICIDAEMEKTTVQSSMAEHQANCSSYDIKKSGDKVSVDAECVFNKSHVSSRTEMSGDFSSAFQVRISSRTWRLNEQKGDQPATPQTRIVTRVIEQAGSFVGAECGDLKPGEAVGTDGQKVLVQ